MTPPPSADTKFQAIARASILSSIENKHTRYISMADRRAQGLLTISAVLAPFALAQIHSEAFFYSSIIFLIGAAGTIICAALCLTPKRFKRLKKSDRFLLHFSYISKQDRDEYLSQMADAIVDTRILAEEVAKDIYHLSHDVIVPKFRWLRVAYASFVTSLCLALLIALYQVLAGRG